MVRETVPVPGGLVQVPLSLSSALGLACRLQADPARLRDCISTRRLRPDPRHLYAFRSAGLCLVVVRVVPRLLRFRFRASRDLHLLRLEVEPRLLASAARALWGLQPVPAAGHPVLATLAAPGTPGRAMERTAYLWSLRAGRLVRSRLRWTARAAARGAASTPCAPEVPRLGATEPLEAWALAEVRLTLEAVAGEFPL